MSHRLDDLRDKVLRRRVEHPIQLEEDADRVAQELRHGAQELAALVGKIHAGTASLFSAMAWAGRAQLQLVLLAHMMGIDLDQAVRDQLCARGTTLAPELPPAIIGRRQGVFRISAAFWLQRPQVVERILAGIVVYTQRFDRSRREWHIAAFNPYFREVDPGEDAPRYSVIITEQQSGAVSVAWEEEK